MADCEFQNRSYNPTSCTMVDQDVDNQEDNSCSKLSHVEEPSSSQEPVKQSTTEGLNKNSDLPVMAKSEGITDQIKTIPERCPRTCACCCGIVVPLWLLIAFALLGGNFLAQLEAPAEYASNDEVLANQDLFFETRQAMKATINELVQLPDTCLIEYLKTIQPEGSNSTLYELWVDNSTALDDGLNVSALSILVHIPGLSTYMRECGSAGNVIIDALLELQNSTSLELVAESLTFNWIRCWNETIYGSRHVFGPTTELIQASSEQSEYYRASWQQNKEYLYNQYLQELGDNSTGAERLDAILDAISNATGSGGCSGNVAASAWFFFTVMTTIGYGNQVILTGSGRGLVAILGFFGILAFGAVSAAASQILIVVFDDFVARFNLKVLSRPAVGVVLWTFVTVAWTLFVADRSYIWWNTRLPDYEQPYASFWDSVWFAYLTTTTVGLGDFYYQPNYIFVADLVTLPLIVLVCFVFFATLISQIASLCSGAFPDAVQNLRNRVERTNLINRDMNDEVVIETKLIQVLQGLLEGDEDESQENASNLSVILKEEQLLQKVLELRTEALQKMAEMGSK